MINPLKISEMLSQAGQMQEEVPAQAGRDGRGGNKRRRRGDRNHERQEGTAEAAHRSRRGSGPERRAARRGDAAGSDRGAVNEAGRKADEAIKSSVQGMLGGLKIPGLGA